MKIKLIAALSAALLCSCAQTTPSMQERDYADVIFVGDHIITMDAATEGETSVAVGGTDIIAVGSESDVIKLRGPDTRVINLGERALIPGFVDSHGHLTFSARLKEFVNVSSPPVGGAETIEDIVDLLARRLDERVATGKWLLGYGYDDSLLSEGRHPTRDDLDQVSAEVPIAIMHVSAHFFSLNTAALAALGIDAETPDPKGGIIRRRPGTKQPDGVLEETATAALMAAGLFNSSADEFERLLRQSARDYASFGITTAQDGATSTSDIRALRAAASREPFAIDIAAFAQEKTLDDDALNAFRQDREYRGGFRVAGVKYSLDGSPQGRTAWLTKPYDALPHGAGKGYVAYPTVVPEDYQRRVAQLIRNNVPVLVHANGDAAIDLMMDGVASANATAMDHRSVAIHSQLMREDQIERALKLGVVPSFFSAHTFFWGDWHRVSFGKQRAENISPAGWAVQRNLPFTVHNDAPVVPPDMMRLLWATVNRQTRSGSTIGPAQKISVRQALHALTLGGAYQYFEEDRKGSITVGKQADLVILDANPLQVEPSTLKDIQIIETFARGASVYKNELDRGEFE